jgi:hypothetical protein
VDSVSGGFVCQFPRLPVKPAVGQARAKPNSFLNRKFRFAVEFRNSKWFLAVALF